jgi:hypothetical protein
MVNALKDWITKLRNPELTNKTSVAEVETAGRIWFPPPIWEAFKGQMIKGDELWEFSSPPETWRMLLGRAGIALVRKGKIIGALVTKRN